MSATENSFKLRWLTALRTAPGLTSKDRLAGEWLAANLALDETVVMRPWWDLRKATGLSNLEAGTAAGNLARVGLLGQRVRTGSNAGFPLLLPQPKRQPSAPPHVGASPEQEARTARRAAAQHAADKRADAKWLARK